MAKTPKTNAEGYAAVIAALEKRGHKHPVAFIARMLGFGRQAVHKWDGVVPEAHALKVSVISGVPVESILPETVVHIQEKLKETA